MRAEPAGEQTQTKQGCAAASSIPPSEYGKTWLTSPFG